MFSKQTLEEVIVFASFCVDNMFVYVMRLSIPWIYGKIYNLLRLSAHILFL